MIIAITVVTTIIVFLLLTILMNNDINNNGNVSKNQVTFEKMLFKVMLKSI